MSFDHLTLMRDSRISLPAYGHVMGQKEDEDLPFNPNAITRDLQNTVLEYVNDTPRDPLTNQTKFLALCGGRQNGKSLCVELALYPKAAYTPGWDHVCMADKKERADYLHERVHFAHQRWPETIRSPTIPSKERRQLTFDPEVKLGGRMRTLSAQDGAAGIGQSMSSFHGSEIPFWPDAGDVWTMLRPAIINRDNALMVLESTPAPADQPSVEWWKDILTDAKHGLDRWLYAFFPFWDGLLARRPWIYGTPTNEELRLLEKWGHAGLSLENLAFRRITLDGDPQIRRNPDLFGVWYPFDDLTCWLGAIKGVIHTSLIEKALARIGHPVEWRGTYLEYEDPEEGAQYVLGADGSGFGVRDHAAFQVLKVYKGEWTQVACFSDNVADPVEFTAAILKAAERYNRALVVVESNGVGAGPLSLLIASGYRNLFYEAKGKPGKWASGKSVDEMTGALCDALRDVLYVFDKDTLDQCSTYRNDKRIEDGAVAEMLRGHIGRGRRKRHHWDKVSALKMAVMGALSMSVRSKPDAEEPDNVVPLFSQMPFDQREQWISAEAARKAPAKRSGSTYRRVTPKKWRR